MRGTGYNTSAQHKLINNCTCCMILGSSVNSAFRPSSSRTASSGMSWMFTIVDSRMSKPALLANLSVKGGCSSQQPEPMSGFRLWHKIGSAMWSREQQEFHQLTFREQQSIASLCFQKGIRGFSAPSVSDQRISIPVCTLEF